MRSGQVTTEASVIAAGVGARQGWRWVLRAASFRVGAPGGGLAAIGIVCPRAAAGATVVDLLAGLVRPSYGELRVLGENLGTAAGRAAVRRRVGVARLSRPTPAFRVRGAVEHAARLAGLPSRDRSALTAAALDRLALTAWEEAPLRGAPPSVARRARLAAACVHEPDLVLVDGLLDGLGPDDVAGVAGMVRGLSSDTAVIAAGRDAVALGLACDEVLTLADGIIVPA